MGHTLATITGHFDRFRGQLSDFRRALRRTDQIAFDALLDEARQHLPAVGYAAHVLPEIMLLFCLFLEEYKRAQRYEAHLDSVREDFQRELNNLRQELLLKTRRTDTKAFLETNGHKA
ncbi:MAG: hypothetical protein WEC37_00720 [Anaerolineales bacterium]